MNDIEIKKKLKQIKKQKDKRAFMEQFIRDAIFALASFLNHDTNPNCFHQAVHERMFIFARKDIKKNEELTIQYAHQGFY